MHTAGSDQPSWSGRSVSRRLSFRFDEIHGRRAAERVLRELAFDVLGPFEPFDLPASDYAWLEDAIDAAVQRARDKAVEQLLAELAVRLESASPAVIAGLDRARNRQLVELR